MIVAVVAAALWSLWPPEEKIHWGLDLEGGVHLVLQVQTDDAIKAELDDAAQRLVSFAADEGVDPRRHRGRMPRRSVSRSRCRRATDREALDDVIGRNFPDYDVTTGGTSWTFAVQTEHRTVDPRPGGAQGSRDHQQPCRPVRRRRAGDPDGRASRATGSSSSCPGWMIPSASRRSSSRRPSSSSKR